MKKFIGIILAILVFVSSAIADALAPPYNAEIELFDSVKSLYERLNHLSEHVARIRDMEEEDMKYFAWKYSGIRKSEGELEYGLFGNFLNILRQNNTLLFPYYRNEPFPLRYEENFILGYVGIAARPTFKFLGRIGGLQVDVSILYYEPSLIEEANAQGAPWLLDAIGYDKLDFDGNQRVTHEAEYKIGERNVLALIFGQEEDPPSSVYFVYDNILVRVSGDSRIVQYVLPHLTFREICILTSDEVIRENSPIAEWQSPFTDLSPDAWYFDAITFMHQQGIMNGHADGRIGAEETLTRAQFATLLWALEDRSEPNSSSYYNFTDVQPEHWHYAAVTWAASNDIVSGVGGSLFNPDAPVSRQQVLQMLYNYAVNFKGIEIPQVQDLPNFSDFDEVDTWAESAVTTLAKAGVMNGFPDEGQLKPRDDTTRGEAAWVLMNFLRIPRG